MLLDLFIVGLLIVANGVLSMSELAVVSSRVPRLQAMQRRAVRGAHAALQLKQAPGRFLSTVQIGITLVGVLAGAFGGATLSEPLAGFLTRHGWDAELAQRMALASVVAGVTWLSLIIGELVPKRVALRHPERIAARVAPAMLWLSRMALPLVWLLDVTSTLLLSLLPGPEGGSVRVTDEEIRAIVAEAASSGVVEPEEKAMIAGVMRLADRRVRAVMTPRQDVDWIDLDDPPEAQRAQLRASRHSKLVAARGHVDQFVGLITTRRLVDAMIDGPTTVDLAAHVEEALVLPESIDALDAMAKLRRSVAHAAIVVDEFGSLQGLVTVTDILSAIAGEFYLGEPPPGMTQREDDSWLVDGDMPVDELAERLRLRLPEHRDYDTVAGLALTLFGHLPQLGESAWLGTWRFEVVDLDGHRIDKLLVRRDASAT